MHLVINRACYFSSVYYVPLQILFWDFFEPYWDHLLITYTWICDVFGASWGCGSYILPSGKQNWHGPLNIKESRGKAVNLCYIYSLCFILPPIQSPHPLSQRDELRASASARHCWMKLCPHWSQEQKFHRCHLGHTFTVVFLVLCCNLNIAKIHGGFQSSLLGKGWLKSGQGIGATRQNGSRDWSAVFAVR